MKRVLFAPPPLPYKFYYKQEAKSVYAIFHKIPSCRIYRGIELCDILVLLWEKPNSKIVINILIRLGMWSLTPDVIDL